jgi:hypothetical protein
VQRLTNPDVNPHAMSQLLGLDFENNFWSSVVTTFGFQVHNFSSAGGKGAVRYCADMMFSGHTVCCALACVSLLQILQKHGVLKNMPFVLRAHVYAVLVGLPLFEGLAVVATAFHYSVDVFVAWLLTFLMWTNPFVETAAAYWIKASNRVVRKIKMNMKAKKAKKTVDASTSPLKMTTGGFVKSPTYRNLEGLLRSVSPKNMFD